MSGDDPDFEAWVSADAALARASRDRRAAEAAGHDDVAAAIAATDAALAANDLDHERWRQAYARRLSAEAAYDAAYAAWCASSEAWLAAYQAEKDVLVAVNAAMGGTTGKQEADR